MKNYYRKKKTRNNRFFAIALFFSLTGYLFAQSITDDFSATGSDRLVRAIGTQRSLLGDEKSQLSYFENVFETRIAYRTNWQVGVRSSYFIPSYWGERKVGWDSFNKYWLQYSNDWMTVQTGSIYTIWGRGSTLALQEDMDQGLDAGINGGMLRLAKGAWKLEAVDGTLRNDPGGFTHTNQLYGANLEYQKNNAQIGANYLKIPAKSYLDQSLQGGYAGYQHTINSIGSVSGWLEGSWQKLAIENNIKHRGVFGSLDFARKGFSIVLDYKDYQYNEEYGNILPFQSPPIVQRDLISKLMSTHPHLIRYNDEIGWQAEATYRPIRPLGFVLYTAQSSVHHGSPMPSLEQKYSPNTESMLESTYRYSHEGNIRVQLSTKQEAIWNDVAGIPQTWSQRTGYLLGWQTPLIYHFTLDAEAERMLTHDKVLNTDITDSYLSGTISYPGYGSLALSYDRTTDKTEPGGQNWFSMELTIPLKSNLQATFFGGQERGGIKCSSGRCRQVNPFEGVRTGVEATF